MKKTLITATMTLSLLAVAQSSLADQYCALSVYVDSGTTNSVVVKAVSPRNEIFSTDAIAPGGHAMIGLPCGVDLAIGATEVLLKNAIGSSKISAKTYAGEHPYKGGEVLSRGVISVVYPFEFDGT